MPNFLFGHPAVNEFNRSFSMERTLLGVSMHWFLPCVLPSEVVASLVYERLLSLDLPEIKGLMYGLARCS